MPAIIGPFYEQDLMMLNRAFNKQSPSNPQFLEQQAAVGGTSAGVRAFALQFGASFQDLTEDALSTQLLGHMGLLPNAGLQSSLKDYLVSVGKANVGIVALQLGQILSGLDGAVGDQAIYRAAALAWNTEIALAYNHSANPANTTPSPVGPSGIPGPPLVLTASDDAMTCAGYDDTFLAPTVGLLSSADVLDGGMGSDILKATLGAASVVSPTLRSIEKVFITAGPGAEFGAAGATGLADLRVEAASGALTFSGVPLATTVGIQNSAAGGALTVKFAGASGPADVANIVLADATGNDDIIVANIETLNVQSTAGTVAATTANSARITAAQAEKITISGDQSLVTTVTGAKVSEISAAAFSEALHLKLEETSGVAITVNAHATHKIALGAGADTLNVIGLAGAAAKDIDLSTAATLAASAIEVIGFAGGTDALKLAGSTATGKAAPGGAQLEGIAAASSLLDAATLAATTAGAHKAIAFRYGADSYILVNDATAALGANDSLVKLTGVAALADAAWAMA
jgi:hypothetical protein